MIWNFLLGPIFFPPRLDGPAYHNFLVYMLRPMIEDLPLALRQRMWFMHDGCPAHFSLLVRNLLSRRDYFGVRWIGQGGPVSWQQWNNTRIWLLFYTNGGTGNMRTLHSVHGEWMTTTLPIHNESRLTYFQNAALISFLNICTTESLQGACLCATGSHCCRIASQNSRCIESHSQHAGNLSTSAAAYAQTRSSSYDGEWRSFRATSSSL